MSPWQHLKDSEHNNNQTCSYYNQLFEIYVPFLVMRLCSSLRSFADRLLKKLWNTCNGEEGWLLVTQVQHALAATYEELKAAEAGNAMIKSCLSTLLQKFL